ncbi:MAG: RagB/SusD family nutrient uptake outer membrane protein [Flavicella sp.]
MRRSKILGFIVFVNVFVCCEDNLELEPESFMTTFWKDGKDADLGIIAIYDAMQSTYREKHFYWGEFRGDNYTSGRTPTSLMSSILSNQLNPQFTQYTAWDALYKMIYRANLAIENIPLIYNYSEDLLGEAYILRAYAYFSAYKVWGDVPIFSNTNLYYSEDLFKARSDKKEVLQLIISDIQRAEDLISDTKKAYRFSKTSVLAFKAHLFMTISETEYQDWKSMQEIPSGKTKYQVADEAIDEIINSGLYSLVRDRNSWRNLFVNDPKTYPGEGQEGSELILSLRFEASSDGLNASAIRRLFFGFDAMFSYDLLQSWSEAFPPPIPKDFSLSASSEWSVGGGQIAKNAKDNDSSTYWASANQSTQIKEEWIELHLGEKVDISGITLTPRGGGQCFPIDFEIQSSTDRVNWNVVLGQRYENYEKPTSGTPLDFVFVSPIETQHIRVLATKLRGLNTNANYMFHLAEINLIEATGILNPVSYQVVDIYGVQKTLTQPYDWRFQESIAVETVDVRRLIKYSKERNSIQSDDTNIIIYRYSELLLLQAEAKNKLGEHDAAIDLVNQIRTARELPISQTEDATKPYHVNRNEAEIGALILAERRYELLGEGFRWWDLVRSGQTGLDENNILWPLNSKVLVVNPKLEQNDFYK